MKFRVIQKPHGNSVAEGANLKEVAMSIDTEPFMIVAMETVAEGEDYQAIQIKPDTVQINFKRGHRFVTANSIAEAYSTEEDDDGDDTKITVSFESAYGNIPNSIVLAEPGEITLPTMTYEDNDYIYEFKGWKLGKKLITSETFNITRDAKFVASWNVTEKPFEPVTYSFTSYAADKETVYANGTAKTLEKPEDGKQKIKVLTNEPEDSENPFIGKILYVNTTPDANGFYQLYDENLNELPIFVKLS